MTQLMQDCRIHPTVLPLRNLPPKNNLLVQVPSLSTSLGPAAVLQPAYEVGKVNSFGFVLWS